MTSRLLWDNVVTYSMQIGLLIGIAAFIPTALRLRMPRARLAFWHILLAVCLLLPLLAPRKQELIVTQAPVAAAAFSPVPMPAVPSRAIPRSQIALGLLAAGMAARLVWLAVGFWKLRRYRLQSRPLEPALSWSVEADLRLSADVSSPVTFGLRKPVVLLPAHFPDLEPHMQDAILCHEILHVRRGDWLFTLAEELVRSVFWFHPAIWWLLGEIGLAREQAVDHEVIEMTKSRDGYLDALLAIAGATPRLDLAPAPLFLRKRHFKQRVVSILKEVRMSKTRRISALAAGLCFLAAAGWFVTVTFPLTAAPQMVMDAPGVTVELGSSAILHRTGVSYPEAAMRGRVQGIVTVEATVDSTGNVVDARVISGPQELRRSALQSVLQWHFAMDSSLNTRRVNINFTTPQMPASPAGVPGGVSGGVLGGVIGGVPSVVSGGVTSATVTSAAGVPRKLMAPSIAGKTLTGYRVNGLTDQSRSDLLSRMPIRAGEILAEDSFERIAKAVHDYDEHLTVGRSMRNEELSIMISAPGTFGVVGGPVNVTPPAPPPGDPNVKRITVGGNVQQAKLVRQPRPAYPPLAKQARISGVVQFQALIGVDGTMKNLTVISGHPLLIPAAMEAVTQWVYEKTLLNGEPVEVLTQIDVNFTLSEE